MYAAHSLPLGSEIIIEVSTMDVVLAMVVRRGAEICKVERSAWSEKQPNVRDERVPEAEEVCGSISQKSYR